MSNSQPIEQALADSEIPSGPEVRLDRSLEKLGLWRATDIERRASGSSSSGSSSSGNSSSSGTAKKNVPGELTAQGATATASDNALVRATAALDALFPDGHWPTADLVELLCDLRGIGELRLLMPTLAQLSQQQARWVAWVAPPHIPYAPALAALGVDIRRILLIHPRSERECLWAMEQALKSGTCSAVLGWPAQSLRQQDIRRLQLAATQGGTLGLLFRPEQAALEASPAPFRLVLRSAASTAGATVSSGMSADCATPQLQVKMLKRRGGWALDFISIALPLTVPPAVAKPVPAPVAPADAPVTDIAPVETLPSLHRHLARWRDAMPWTRRPSLATGLAGASANPLAAKRLVINRRPDQGTVSCTPPAPRQPRRSHPEDSVKPVF